MIDSDVLNSDVTLTGVMEGKTFTITIKSNNSNNQTRTYSAKYGERFTLPSCPFSAVTNYTFNNYTCNGSTYSVGGGFTVTGNMTVTCNWTYHAPTPPAPANNFTVEFGISRTTEYGPQFECLVLYKIPKVTGTYKNKEIGVRFYNGGGYSETTLRTDKPITEQQIIYNGAMPMYMYVINKIELRNGKDGAVLATRSVTPKDKEVTTVTMTLS